MSIYNPLKGEGFFKNARHFTISNSILSDSSVHMVNGAEPLINVLSPCTIKGAEYDSSERDPPPKCHPETRLEFCERIMTWMHDLQRVQRMLWLRGSAGVGKSAIMQTIAEIEADSPNSTLGATVFFSRPNGRDDPKCLFTTIAYQLAVNYPLYRQYINDILARDPKIVEKSVSQQFNWFIAKAFVEKDVLQGLHETVTIVLDGMDECKGEEAQRDIILLIRRFVFQHPDVPLIWLITSRPEPHIHTAFSTLQVPNCHWEIDIPVDSTQACADVERFLRDNFLEIGKRYAPFFSPGDRTWPSEIDFLKIAKASSGHFLFAHLVVRFIVDESYGNPVSQLQTVLTVIESTLSSEIQSNPFALLDNLYTQILAGVPLDVLPTTKQLLAWCFCLPLDRHEYDPPGHNRLPFALICNLLNLDQAAVCGALRKLHSVIQIPPTDEVHHTSKLQAFHASFVDYLKSPTRSGQYCATVSLEELMSHLLQKLLESHNSAASVIEPSRMHVSWVYGAYGKADIQIRIWSETFYFVTVLIPEMITSTASFTKDLEQLAMLFRHIDYGRFLNDDIRAMFGYPLCRRPELFSTLQEWGVARRIGFRSIDLDCIRRGLPIGLAIQYSLNKPTIPPFLRDGLKLESRDSLDWTDQVEQHLSEIVDFGAPVDVVLVGIGCKSAVWITHTRGDWFYTFPYNES